MRRRALVLGALLAMLAGAPFGPVPSAIAGPVSPPPGTVRDVHELAPALWPDGTGRAYRVTYWSTGSRNEPVLVNGTVFLPHGRPPAGGWPTVDYEHGTVGLAPACAPSTAGNPAYVQDYLSTWIHQGYAVVASDFVLNGGVLPYLDGATMARNAIDLVRAARETFHHALSTRWVATGHSEGGHATLFTATLATRYAPELDYRGAVAAAPATGIVDEFVDRVGPGTPDTVAAVRVAFFGYVLRGLKAARPDFDLDAYLTPAGRRFMADAERLCIDDLIQDIEEHHITIGASLTTPMAKGDFAAIAHPVIDIPLAGYDRPVLVVHGTADADLPIAETDRLVADLTATGVTDLTYRRYDGVGHEDVLSAALVDTVPYVRNLFG